VRRLVCAVVVLAGVMSARAQMFSLQSMDDLWDFYPGVQDIHGSIGVTDDINTFGARYNFTVSQSIRVFGGVGYAEDSDDSDTFTTILSGGALWRLPAHMADNASNSQTALRGELVVPIHEDITAYLIMLGVHGALNLSADGKVRGYGGAGIYYLDYEEDYEMLYSDGFGYHTESATYSDTELGLYLTAGASYAYSECVKFYGEVMYMDTKDFEQDVTVGVGVGVAL
jgi:hypothetical protein